MSTTSRGRTTTSVEGVPNFDVVSDPTTGLALVYSRLHAHLPAAVPFALPVVTLGRESDNSLSIPEAAVSRYHARFERRDEQYWVVDLQSTNGTFVNGRRVREQPLAAHDVVRIGDTIFRYVDRAIYGYGAYRIDGHVVEQARPFSHGVTDPLLVGGYQLDAITDRIAKVARSSISVVVHGESGTGKELVARELHRQSGRSGAFQAINCAALPATLIESELFGYRRGAFSGANTDKVGLVRAAHGGTLFLDEIGDMALEAQGKLLRVLQEKEVTPVGATAPERVDVRVVCATHRDLEADVAKGRFRPDLHGRLRDLALVLPPLRERREDLYSLVLHFMRAEGVKDPQVTFPFMLAIAHYAWPYNVRELERAVSLAITLASGQALDIAHLPDTVRRALDRHGAPASGAPGEGVQAPNGGSTLRDHASPAASVRPPEPGVPPGGKRGDAPNEEQLRALLTRHNGNIAAVGRELGKERMQVHRWLRRYQLDPDQFRR
jgi:sigma-54 dependent transcriptional regulator, acetoin dehydrogenase operon transcriptional activator AcoR